MDQNDIPQWMKEASLLRPRRKALHLMFVSVPPALAAYAIYNLVNRCLDRHEQQVYIIFLICGFFLSLLSLMWFLILFPRLYGGYGSKTGGVKLSPRALGIVLGIALVGGKTYLGAALDRHEASCKIPAPIKADVGALQVP